MMSDTDLAFFCPPPHIASPIHTSITDMMCPVQDQSVSAAISRYHRLGGLKDRNENPDRSESRSVKVSSGCGSLEVWMVSSLTL